MKITISLIKIYEEKKDLLAFHGVETFEEFKETMKENRGLENDEDLQAELEEDLFLFLTDIHEDYATGLIDL